MSTVKRTFDKEFKERAVQLAADLKSISEAARQLGIAPTNIHNWREELGLKSEQAAKSEPYVEEIKRLKKENEELKKVNYILKKAAAFFSQDHLK